jgi:dolichol kinase
MAWLVLIVGTALFLAGIAGQVFGLNKRKGHPEDRRAGWFVLRIVSAVAGLWLVCYSAAHVAHLHAAGKF